MNTRQQLENAKIEVTKPFPHEEELTAKTVRLAELNALLDMDKKDSEIVDETVRTTKRKHLTVQTAEMRDKTNGGMGMVNHAAKYI